MSAIHRRVERMPTLQDLLNRDAPPRLPHKCEFSERSVYLRKTTRPFWTLETPEGHYFIVTEVNKSRKMSAVLAYAAKREHVNASSASKCNITCTLPSSTCKRPLYSV